MGTLIYSPGIRVHVASSRHGLIDVSEDLSSGSLTLRESNISSFRFSVLNTGGKYDRVFAPNDRIVVQMKRIGAFLPVFAGYLDQVPYFTVYPRTVELLATCTLKRLRYTVWDAGSEAAINLLHGSGQADQPGQPNSDEAKAKKIDGGIKQQVQDILTKVALWHPEAIHIGEVPSEWLTKVEALRNLIQPMLAVPDPTAGAGQPGAAGGATTGGGGPAGINAFMHAVRTVESHGDYHAGNGGAYQVLPSNWPSWKAEAGVNDPSSTAEQASPQVQDAVARFRMTQLFKSYNNWSVVAQVWNGGHPGAHTTWTSNAQGQKVPYEQAVLSYMPQFANEDLAAGSPGGPALPGQAPVLGPPAPSQTAKLPGAPPQPGTKTNTAFVQLCLAQRGDQYIYGAQPSLTDTDPKAFDCSALVQWAAARCGVTVPRTSGQQFRACHPISIADAFKTPGALLFRGPDEHVAISLGDGQNTIEARGAAYGVNEFGLAGRQWDVAGLIIGLDYGDMTPQGPGGAAGIPGGGTELFNNYNWIGNAPDPESIILSGYRALLNDDPLLPTVQTLMGASMRSFMSGPNGDFIAWFPDYFGIYGTAGKMIIEDIELAGDGFSVVWNDQALITHQFAAGARTGLSYSDAPGALQEASDLVAKYQTEGVVTVEFPDILSAVINANHKDPDAADWLDSNKILQRFGARVDFSPMGYINQGPAEFWYALFLFQQAWASQFMTQVSTTFMPEVWPGMLIKLEHFKFQAYVRAVTHTFDFGGGGFSTSIEVMAPSATDGSGLYGMVAA